MKQVEFLYLSQKDVADAGLTMKNAITIVEDVLTEHGHKKFENPPKPGIHTLKGTFIHAMPGFLPRKKAAGMKWVSGYSDNFQYGLPSIMGLIILNDPNTGQPVAVMDGGYITALRTAAASGVSARYLAVKDAGVLGIVGTGVQGRYNLLSLKEVLPRIEKVKIFDTNESVLKEFISFAKEHAAFKIITCGSAQEVIEGTLPGMTLRGIIYFGDDSPFSYIFYSTAEKKNMKLKAGEEILGAALKKIEPDSAVFAHQGQLIQVSIGQAAPTGR